MQSDGDTLLTAAGPLGAEGEEEKCDGDESCAIFQRVLAYEFSEDDLEHLESV